MSEAKKYDRSYKEQSVKLALEIGVKRASEELKVPYGTLYGWVQAAKNGDLDIEERTPENAMSLAEENCIYLKGVPYGALLASVLCRLCRKI